MRLRYGRARLGIPFRRGKSARRARKLIFIPPALLALLLGGGWILFRVAVAWWPYPTGIAQLPADSIRIEDRNGVNLAAFAADDGQWRFRLTEDQISPHLLEAIVAVEDSRFDAHHGVDWRSVAAATWEDLIHFGARRGASTLTMQLQRLRDPHPRTLINKVEQAIRAEQIERRSTKKQILVEYVNRAPFGGNLIGAGAASWRYFDRDCRQLSLGQAALLAGLPQSPNRLRPDRFPLRAKARRDHVLDRMLTCGFITERQRAEAAAEPIDAAWHALPQDRGPDDLPPADGALPTLAGVARQDKSAVIRSTLDSRIQRQAALAARNRLRSLLPSDVSAAAVVVLDTHSGQELAAVSLNGSDSTQLDLTERSRSTGSTLKPFIYAAAFDAGIYGPQSILSDSPAAWPGYEPNDFDRTFRGKLTAAEALAESRNIPAMIVLSKVGVQPGIGVMDALGLHGLARHPGRYGLSLAIGGAEASPRELAQAYATLGRGGGASHCLRPAACWQMLNALADTNRTTAVCPEAAASHVAWKTGTSSGKRDAWCAAVTRRYTVVVWLGNAQGEGSAVLVGQEAAAPLALQLIALLDPADDAWPNVTSGAPNTLIAGRTESTGLVIVRPGQGERLAITSDLPLARQRVKLEAAP
ncbi:MAG TPA: penicillin-binding protein 1C, partial [Tepidisphaeraceae bacterium]|nr:penicillin-binding protein 1C [Tepidisphaeraceae bacterium]